MELAIMAAVAAGTLAAVVLIHYEALSALNTLLPRIGRAPRRRVAVLIVALLLVHIVEIALFAASLWLATRWGLGEVRGAGAFGPADAFYLSSESYTTLGLGNVSIHGPARLLAGLEGLAGLLLIAWSASFTYLEMERDWRR